ncbi:MAG: M48 family metallopeptidase [Opitutales bacterium]|nr:M48 family metallopeptidase [Opitutales bacterium]
MTFRGAKYFDGRSPVAQAAVVRLDSARGVAGIFAAAESGEPADPPLAEVRVDALYLDPPVGAGPWVMRLPDGAVCECPQEVYTALARERTPGTLARFSRWAESSGRVAVVCFLLSVVLVVVFFRYGIPLMAENAARGMPAEIETMVARESMRALDRTFLSPSALAPERKEALRDGFDAFAARKPATPTYRIEFRRSRIGPNAFALPAGLIVITDELVELAETDAEVYAVAAHELGHVHHNHGMRSALQAAGHFIVITVFLGDVSSVLSVAAALPSVLIETGHSRRFELEADTFAAEFGMATGLGVAPLVSILESLTDAYGGEGKHLSWISTHPPTAERVELLRAIEAEHPE